jgi:hypothetical protein
MKKNTYPLFLVCILLLSLAAKTPDDASHHQMMQYLKLLPDTLYFNQDYAVELPGMAEHNLSVSISDYPSTKGDNSMSIFVPWSNREYDKKIFTVYEGGNLIGEKPVYILQKLRGNVSDDNGLFLLDDHTIDLKDNIQPESFRQFKTFNINPERFQQKDMKVSGFSVRVMGTRQIVTNTGNAINEKTRSFISRLKTGDAIIIENIKCSYQKDGHAVSIDLNYTPSITLTPSL